MARWYVAPAFFSPKVITKYSNKPTAPGALNAVLFTSSGAMKIWLYQALPSIKLIILWLAAALIIFSATGIGYLSFGIALLRSLKSTQTRHRPSFFCTGTTLEI